VTEGLGLTALPDRSLGGTVTVQGSPGYGTCSPRTCPWESAATAVVQVRTKEL